MNRKSVWASSALVCSLISGCHHRAQTDVYVDSMAGEIRDLEDQLYQYDHEYRLLEQELESLRRRNAMLNSAGTANSQSEPLPLVPKKDKKSEPVDPPKEAPRSPAPSNSSTKPGTGSESNGAKDPQTPPSILNNNNQPFQFPNTPPSNSPSNSPSNTPENLPAPPNKISPPNQQTDTPSTDLEFDAGDFIVPTITTGSLAPPTLDTAARSESPDKDLEMSLSQIEMPSQLAGGRNSTAKITTAVQMVTDKRIVEIAFQPALSRAVSFDGDNQDDGLFLVLQPKNEQGQVVAIAGAVSIEVIDPSREGNNPVIGKWNYSPAEIEDKIQPIGSKQGIHLTLPWNGPNPKADRVIVVATYQLDNGRKVIGKKEIFLNSGTGLKTVWTPRSTRDSSPAQVPTSKVLQASGESSASSANFHPVQPVGSFPAPESAPAPEFQR